MPSKKTWEQMTPEQQKAIGEAAIRSREDWIGRENDPVLFQSARDLFAAVRAAQRPTWSQDYGGLVCSDGRAVSIGFRGGEPLSKREYEAFVAAGRDALNAREARYE